MDKAHEKFMPFCLPTIERDEINEVVAILRSGWLSTGPKTRQFEKDFASYIGVKYAIGLTSCTASLHLALLAHGVGPGDEVIMPSFTFASCANMVVNVGAKPIFVDIREDTLNIDPEKIKGAITRNTKAIVPVHYGGNPYDIEAVNEIAKNKKLIIIEDAAHALGSEYRGKKIGSFGNTTCFSFYPTKCITTGEGGMLTTNNRSIADFVIKNRLHGISKDAWKRYSKGGSWRYDIEYAGWKYNMFDIQAALGICQLKKADKFMKIRNEYASLYTDGLKDLKRIKIFSTEALSRHAYHLYPILVEGFARDLFIEKLAKKNIAASVHFIPLHMQSFYRKKFGYKRGILPITEGIFRRIVSLPLYPKMTKGDVNYVIHSVKEILS